MELALNISDIDRSYAQIHWITDLKGPARPWKTWISQDGRVKALPAYPWLIFDEPIRTLVGDFISAIEPYVPIAKVRILRLGWQRRQRATYGFFGVLGRTFQKTGFLLFHGCTASGDKHELTEQK